MLKRLYFLGTFAWIVCAQCSLAAVVKFEAESGVLGAGFTNGTDGLTTFISISSTAVGTAPTNSSRVANYTVNFPAAGTYDLYARVRVGMGDANDDSFFYGNGFGPQTPTDPADWILVNSINTGGFTNATDLVSGSGTARIQVWKWINLSQYTGTAGDPPITFTVTPGNLTQDLQIGAREDGLDLDAFVFGTTGYNFTVANLDAGADGTPVVTNNAAVRVNWTDVRQRIDGFGASSAWRSTWNSTVADRYFSTNTGLGLSLLRTRIAPGGTSVETNIMALARDRGARVWSSPWTPTTAFKTPNANGVLSLNGGNFVGNASNYQAYASVLATYVVNMKNKPGVNLYALSIQNEPDFITTNYESCGWTGQQIHDFVPYLSATLAASNVGATKILIPESANWGSNPGLYTTTMNDAAVAPLVGIIANHNYVANNNSGDQNPPAALNSYGKALWETEVSTFSPYDPSMTNGIYWAKRLHAFFTVAQVNGWHYWWFNASDNSGIADAGDNLAKRGYVLGQYSRFVRPDFNRIGVVTNSGAAMVSAYRDTNSLRFAIVAINPQLVNPIALSVNLTNLTTNLVTSVTPWITSSSLSLAAQSPVTVSNSTFTYTLPASSVVTFVGQTTSNSPPVLTLLAQQIVNAGVVLTLTNVAVDPNAPPQTLAFSLLNAPAGATLNSASGVFSWRAPVGYANTTNPVAVRAADNGTPPLSATNNFSIVVNPVTNPVFSSVAITGGVLKMTITGPAGPDYTVQTTTNLTVPWQTLFVTNSPPIPFSVTDPNLADPERFYRSLIGP